jgi:hypothetical protein
VSVKFFLLEDAQEFLAAGVNPEGVRNKKPGGEAAQPRAGSIFSNR